MFLPGRQQIKIKRGDTIHFYYHVYEHELKKENWQKGEALSFTKINTPKAYFSQAEDYQGNISTSNI